MSKRVYLWLIFCSATLFGALLFYSYFIEPRRLVVRQHVLEIQGLDRRLDGLQVLLVSDIHGGSNHVTEESLDQLVKTANEQSADLILILGDFVSLNLGRDPESVAMPIETIANHLKGLRAKYGVYAVLGNHDVAFGPDKIIEGLEVAKIRVLNGEILAIKTEKGCFRLLGLKDHTLMKNWRPFSDQAREIIDASKTRENEINNLEGPENTQDLINSNCEESDIIALDHSPDVAPAINGDLLISPNLKLILAGHTHGGQVWLPIIGSPWVPSSFGQKFAAGAAKENGIDVFVTTGVGTSILPFRFLVPPEIVVLTLRPA